MTKPITRTTTCPKCDGNKTINAFNHYANGICFRCNGAGVVKLPLKELKAREVAKQTLATKRSWLLKATDRTLANLKWEQIYEVHQFAVNCVVCGDTEIARIFPMIKAAFEKAI